MKPDNQDAVETQRLTPADITRIAETEGSRAADAALQRMVRAREAGTLSKIDEADNLLGDIGLDASGETEVIEHLDELDAAVGDAPIDKIKRELAEPAATKEDEGGGN